MDRYKLYCVTDAKEECVIASAVPTECPTNSEHTITASTVRVVDQNVLVNDGCATDLTLADYKQLRYNEIDYKTGQLIAGFTYDSVTFSLSASAQMNWATLKNQESEFTWPVEVSTLNQDPYSLAQEDLGAFWTAARDEVQYHLDSGRTLKESVFDAANESEVDAVVDSR